MPKVTKKKTASKKVAPKLVIKSKAVARPVVKMAVNGAMIPSEFVSFDNANYNFSLGKIVASSFSGFLAGIIVTSLIWIVVVNVFFVG